MAINPVFLNEIRQSAFRRRGLLLTTALIAVASFLCLLAQFEGLRNLIVYAPVAFLPLIVPAIAAGAFAKEYEQQTWLDLYLTRLTNAQVVWGKFGAYFLQIAIGLVTFAPSLILMLLGDYSRKLSELHAETVPIGLQIAAVVTGFSFLVKLLLSATLYILLSMICSRYSPNRRTAITWSYIAMAVYSALGFLTWTLVGSLDYQNSPVHSDAIDLTPPGFMESVHLLVCGVVGVGSLVLLWISLSEQRGYRGGAEASNTRAWQPIAREMRDPIR